MENKQSCCHRLEFGFIWRNGKQVLTVVCREHGYEESIELEKVNRFMGPPPEAEERIHYAHSDWSVTH